MSDQAAVGKLNTNVASSGTLFKLVAFSLSLGIVPLASYYASLHFVWDGNSTFAAITAVFAANLVLVIYIVLSILDDRQTQQSSPRLSPPESKKER
ncbi:hypothetical protein BDP27DRAFT_1314782 [Rhodocollybia butyracea]|uniref:Vacuolar ATPase assembly integral membrane protein VMA21 homolog n=1 Tax=Rhodocollybia butyracea TaxID=206335 RepID=A0A9P5UE79_9AGAR|nr:hypothetical protein BDP27DRAFT_1314782 [Rhodocollybia butyracea]